MNSISWFFDFLNNTITIVHNISVNKISMSHAKMKRKMVILQKRGYTIGIPELSNDEIMFYKWF